ncbi:MAG: hypothetical protein ACRENE_19195, partial [Polyangiaceae bacterium]
MVTSRFACATCAACAASAVVALVAGSAGAQSDDAQSALAAGLESAAKSDYAEAERLLSGVTGSRRPEALLALARTSLEQGRYAQAED